MNGVGYALNGVPLDTAHCVVTQGSSLFAGVSVSRSKTSAPFRHGTVPAGLPPTFEERSVTIKATAFGAAGTGMDSSRLARLCMSPHPVLSRTVDGQVQEAVVELASLEADDGGTVVGRVTPFTAVFAMPGVWWRDPTAFDRQVPANTTSGLWPTPFRTTQRYWTRWSGAANNSPSLLADSLTFWMGAADDSPSVLVSLSDGGLPDGMFGDAPITDPIIRLPKGVTSVTVTDPVSGTGVTWAGNADAIRYTYLDPANARAWQTLQDAHWTADGMIDVTGGLDYPAAGMLQCWPDPVSGAYRLTTRLTGGSGPLLVHVRRAWW